MRNEFILTILNHIEGYKTRLTELHWSSPNLDIHRLCDEFSETLRKYEDNLAEVSISLWGEILAGDLNPIPSEDTDFLELLSTILGKSTEVKREAKDNLMWTGIENLTDDFITTISKYIYQTRIAYKTL